jgi:hypothetical protein
MAVDSLLSGKDRLAARWKAPAIIVVAAVVAMAVGLWATRQQPENSQEDSAAKGSDNIRPAISQVPELNPGAQMVLETFVTQPSETINNRDESTLVPEEWEQPLFDILMNDEQSMDERNTRLLELATGAARNVPAVQEECLMHLLFGIPDSNPSQFLAVATNSAIPVQMRAEFLKEALAMRPTEIGEWLSQQVSNHHEPEISTIARLYLLDSRSEAE